MAHGSGGRAQVGMYAACYLLWMLLSALGLWIFFQLQTALTQLMRVLSTDAYVVNTVVRAGTLLLGLVWLGGVILSESYLRDGVIEGRLWGRAGRVLLGEVALLAVAALPLLLIG
ncbi:MAG: hypothetical protein M3Q29_13410 [Chloroflexota bacterium]|nr:hypothetical protein [Chloroflexota bacterium]